MILADTSAWVEFDRATRSPVDERITHLIESGADLAVTEPVVMEVCAGARTPARERDLRRLLSRFRLLAFDPIADFDGAVTIYRTCRRSGITPRGLIDCMIAAVALRHDAVVAAHDRDFAHVASIIGVRLDPSSLS